MDAMQQMLAKDAERMKIIQEAVALATGYIEDRVDDTLVQQYMLYKVGGNILMKVLESFDKKLMTQDLMELGAGSLPPVPQQSNPEF